MKIFVVGAGLGEQNYLTIYAEQIIKSADIVLTTKRIYEKLGYLNENTVCKEISELTPFIISKEQNYDKICVLVSGDVGFYSMAKTLKEKLQGYDMEFINGISSLQYLTAKLQIPYDDVNIISVHGRENTIISNVCYNKKTFALTGGKYKADNIIRELCDVGLGEVLITIGENLSDTNERIITDKAKNLLEYTFDNLSVVLIENLRFVNPHNQIKDSEFIRGKSPMTKESVRVLSIAKLDISPSDVVYDIGAGTGSVAVEMARKAFKGTVFAIEKQEDACDLIKQNVQKLGAYNIKIINALAPSGIAEIIPADKAFIGGSSGNLSDIVSLLISKNPKVRITVNAITLETLNEAIKCFEEFDFDVDIICVNVSKAERVGKYNMMKSENPIYIITGEKA